MRERFALWHEEKLGGPHGPPDRGCGDRSADPQSVVVGVVVAVISLLPPYSFHGVFDVMVPAAALTFLAFYFARSRFAWHVPAIQVLSITPLYVLFSFSWRFQRALHPWIVWVPVVGTVCRCGDSLLVSEALLHVSGAAEASCGGRTHLTNR